MVPFASGLDFSPLASYWTLGCACCLMGKRQLRRPEKNNVANIGPKKKMNLVLSFMILLWNVKFMPVRPTSSTSQNHILLRATKYYIKRDVFPFVVLESLPLKNCL